MTSKEVLLQALNDFLKEDVQPQLSGASSYKSRIARNLINLLLREESLGGALVKLDETGARTVNRVEAHGLRQPSKGPIKVVGPGVIGAAEATGIAAWRALESGAPMTAHVEKRLQVAFLGAGDEDRHTGLAMRGEISRIRQLGAMRDRDRELTEQHLDLSLEVIGIGVLRHRVLHHIIEHLGGVVFVEVEDPTDDLALVVGGAHRGGP